MENGDRIYEFVTKRRGEGQPFRNVRSRQGQRFHDTPASGINGQTDWRVLATSEIGPVLQINLGADRFLLKAYLDADDLEDANRKFADYLAMGRDNPRWVYTVKGRF